jgi:hypothetical protein
MEFYKIAILAFIVGALYDALNVGFMHTSEKGHAFWAGIFSVLVGGCALTGVWQVIHHPNAVGFLLAGYFVGTFFAVKYKKKAQL